jgi:hypothetical protein
VLVLVLVLVLDRCCLQKRCVNPIGSAFPELHPRSGLEAVPKGRQNGEFVHLTPSKNLGINTCRRYSTSNPLRRAQFGLGAVLQYSRTPSLRAAGFEDEDDDEDENEVTHSPQKLH